MLTVKAHKGPSYSNTWRFDINEDGSDVNPQDLSATSAHGWLVRSCGCSESEALDLLDMARQHGEAGLFPTDGDDPGPYGEIRPMPVHPGSLWRRRPTSVAPAAARDLPGIRPTGRLPRWTHERQEGQDHECRERDRYRKEVARIAAGLRRLADDVERAGTQISEKAPAPPFAWAAKTVINDIAWSVANLTLGSLVTAAAEADQYAEGQR